MTKVLYRKVRKELRRVKHELTFTKYVSIKRKHLRKFCKIMRLLNTPSVIVKDLIKPAKWLLKHNYGRFNQVTTTTNEDGLRLPTVKIGKLKKISFHVHYEFSNAAVPYLMEIFAVPGYTRAMRLPKFIHSQFGMVIDFEIHEMPLSTKKAKTGADDLVESVNEE